MKKISLLFMTFFLFACSGEQVVELAFKKTLKDGLIDKCGEADKECINDVKTQFEGCIEKSDWRKFATDDSKAEEKRFTTELFSCFVNSKGKPYFRSTL